EPPFLTGAVLGGSIGPEAGGQEIFVFKAVIDTSQVGKQRPFGIGRTGYTRHLGRIQAESFLDIAQVTGTGAAQSLADIVLVGEAAQHGKAVVVGNGFGVGDGILAENAECLAGAHTGGSPRVEEVQRSVAVGAVVGVF